MAHLDMDRANGEEHDENEHDTVDPSFESGSHVREELGEPSPPYNDADDLVGAEYVGLGLHREVVVGLADEGKASNDHHRVEGEVLMLEEEASGSVVVHDAVVEGRVEAVEHDRVKGEEGHELDVGVVLGVVGDHCEGRVEVSRAPYSRRVEQ
jgi:hypothetical protein